MRVLVIEDDAVLAETVGVGLRREEMTVDIALDGEAGLDRALHTDYDVIVLDRDLPLVPGDEVCRRLVDAGRRSRVLMLTAAGSMDDLVDGLELGADDYLPKPFHFPVLVARIGALYRRAQPAIPPVLRHDDVELDRAQHRVTRHGSGARPVTQGVRGARAPSLLWRPDRLGRGDARTRLGGLRRPLHQRREGDDQPIADQAGRTAGHRDRPAGRISDLTMPARARQTLAQLFKGARMPRHTVRLRLTLLYGGLFLASSAALLAVTYVVVRNLTGGPYVAISNHGLTIAGVHVAGGPPPSASGAVALSGGSGQVTHIAAGSGSGPLTPTPKQLEAQARQLRRVAVVYHDSELQHLLVTYGIALGIMAIVSLGLGWLVAGRILRPLRTITATTRAIGVTDLHQRLALGGPDDELKELGDTVDGLLERLESSFASQKQFVANASHELRTPLARQRTLGQVALSDPNATTESLRAAHERILASGEEQEQLIDTLLTLSRVQGGVLKSKPVELAELVGELLQAREPEATARGVHITEDLQRARLYGDSRLIDRLAANLIDNALRHNVPGGSVTVTTSTRAGASCLCVTNDGPLVRPEDIERLYEPFERLDSLRPSSSEGFGLGTVHRKGRGLGAQCHPRHPSTPNRGTLGGGPLSDPSLVTQPCSVPFRRVLITPLVVWGRGE